MPRWDRGRRGGWPSLDPIPSSPGGRWFAFADAGRRFPFRKREPVTMDRIKGGRGPPLDHGDGGRVAFLPSGGFR